MKKLRFATPKEVDELTALKPGSIPPFGSLFGQPTYRDEALSENDRINFNAGEHAISIGLLYTGYVRAEPDRGLRLRRRRCPSATDHYASEKSSEQGSVPSC